MTSIRPTKFAHVVYRTRRFEQMLRWYKSVFGARVQYQNPGLAFLTYDDEHHRFAFANMGVFQPNGTETERRGAIGVDHVAYTQASLRHLLENYARLREEGITPYWCIHHGISASLYYADPDGNQMEFQVDSYTTSEEASAFINAHWDANPLGVEFDPEDWLARLRAGGPESDFLLRRVHEPASPLRGEAGILSASQPRAARPRPVLPARGRYVRRLNAAGPVRRMFQQRKEEQMSNLDSVRGIYDAFAKGDIPSVLGFLSPDVEWTEAEGFPYGGTYVGPDAVLQGVFMRLGAEWEGFSAVPDEFIDGGDAVVALGKYGGTYKATRKSLRANFAHVWTIREGKAVRFVQYVDTLLVHRALQPQAKRA